jgi:hypothetical protein
MKKQMVISATEYAKKMGITRQAVAKRLIKGDSLPGIKFYYKSGTGKTSHYILIME